MADFVEYERPDFWSWEGTNSEAVIYAADLPVGLDWGWDFSWSHSCLTTTDSLFLQVIYSTSLSVSPGNTFLIS